MEREPKPFDPYGVRVSGATPTYFDTRSPINARKALEHRCLLATPMNPAPGEVGVVMDRRFRPFVLAVARRIVAEQSYASYCDEHHGELTYFHYLDEVAPSNKRGWVEKYPGPRRGEILEASSRLGHLQSYRALRRYLAKNHGVVKAFLKKELLMTFDHPELKVPRTIQSVDVEHTAAAGYDVWRYFKWLFSTMKKVFSEVGFMSGCSLQVAAEQTKLSKSSGAYAPYGDPATKSFFGDASKMDAHWSEQTWVLIREFLVVTGAPWRYHASRDALRRVTVLINGVFARLQHQMLSGVQWTYGENTLLQVLGHMFSFRVISGSPLDGRPINGLWKIGAQGDDVAGEFKKSIPVNAEALSHWMLQTTGLVYEYAVHDGLDSVFEADVLSKVQVPAVDNHGCNNVAMAHKPGRLITRLVAIKRLLPHEVLPYFWVRAKGAENITYDPFSIIFVDAFKSVERPSDALVRHLTDEDSKHKHQATEGWAVSPAYDYWFRMRYDADPGAVLKWWKTACTQLAASGKVDISPNVDVIRVIEKDVNVVRPAADGREIKLPKRSYLRSLLLFVLFLLLLLNMSSESTSPAKKASKPRRARTRVEKVTEVKMVQPELPAGRATSLRNAMAYARNQTGAELETVLVPGGPPSVTSSSHLSFNFFGDATNPQRLAAIAPGLTYGLSTAAGVAGAYTYISRSTFIREGAPANENMYQTTGFRVKLKSMTAVDSRSGEITIWSGYMNAHGITSAELVTALLGDDAIVFSHADIGDGRTVSIPIPASPTGYQTELSYGGYYQAFQNTAAPASQPTFTVPSGDPVALNLPGPVMLVHYESSDPTQLIRCEIEATYASTLTIHDDSAKVAAATPEDVAIVDQAVMSSFDRTYSKKPTLKSIAKKVVDVVGKEAKSVVSSVAHQLPIPYAGAAADFVLGLFGAKEASRIAREAMVLATQEDPPEVKGDPGFHDNVFAALNHRGPCSPNVFPWLHKVPPEKRPEAYLRAVRATLNGRHLRLHFEQLSMEERKLLGV